MAGALEPGQIYTEVSSSIVVVKAAGLKEPGSTIFGSGVLVEDGLVVTNCHVVKDAGVITVMRQPRMSRAIVSARDERRDLCMLSLNDKEGFTHTLKRYMPINQIHPGDRVYAIGSPAGLELSISEGLVSAVREIRGIKLIQTTAAISRGSSGGGLFDSRGNLVGITSFYLSESQNLNFAYPADYVSELLVTALGQVPQAPTITQLPRAESPASVVARPAPAVAPVEEPPKINLPVSPAELARVGIGLAGPGPKVAPIPQPAPTPATAPPAPIAAAAPPMTWDEVLAHPSMKGLSSDQLDAARRQYFMDVVVPVVPADQIQQAWEAFDRDTRPSIVAHAKPPAQPSTPKDQHSAAAAESPSMVKYHQVISAKIKQYEEYPPVAKRRHWEGTTVVQLRFTPEGKVANISVVEKSGYEILDEAAVKMIRSASPLPLPPEGVRTVRVPIKFKLDGVQEANPQDVAD